MAVLDQRRRTVMIKGGNFENAYEPIPISEQRVYERCNRRTLGRYQQRAEQCHRDHYRREPKLLANAQEGPKLDNEASHPNPSQNCRFILDAAPTDGSRQIQ
jgi:hypothetical protein